MRRLYRLFLYRTYHRPYYRAVFLIAAAFGRLADVYASLRLYRMAVDANGVAIALLLHVERRAEKMKAKFQCWLDEREVAIVP